MRTILLSAGLGERLRPLTEKTPKCLIPINGKPHLDIWLEKLTEAHLGPFLINTHYLAKQVEDYIGKSKYKKEVTLVHESKLLGTAGTLMKNIDFYKNEDGLLIHADNYCLSKINKLVTAHKNRPSNCVITMMTFRTETPSTCGIVELDKRGVVTGFYEKIKSPPSNLANGAIYVLSRDLLKRLKEEFSNLSDFSLEVLPKLIGKIYTYETKNFFIDIGTVKSYKKANLLHNNPKNLKNSYL